MMVELVLGKHIFLFSIYINTKCIFYKELYINNEKFKEKAKFIYSVIDYDKYVKFVEDNQTIENPNELIISYSVVDSDGVKVNVYNIGITDISFVF
jgi:uncharacterized short protein YbdD (DUF466 family)